MMALRRSCTTVLTGAIAVAVAAVFIAPPAEVQAQEAAEGQRDYVSQLPPLIDRNIFFGNPEITGGQLSPDGRFVSFIAPLDGVLNVWVKGIDEPFDAARPMTADTARPVTGYFWSEDGERILHVQDKGGDENYRLYAVDPDAAPAEGSPAPAATDLTPYEDVRAVLIALPESDPTTVLVGLNDRDPSLHDVYRVDIHTGERTLVRQNDEGIARWTADLEGNLRLATQIDGEGNTVVYRVEPDSLVQIYTCGPLESCGPVRFTPDGSQVYFISNHGDTDLIGLYLMDPATGETELVEEDPEGRVDFGSPVFSEATDELIATVYEDERARVYPKDDEFAADIERLREEFGEVDFSFRSMTEDGRWMLAGVSSDVQPSSTYVYDRETGDFTLLYETRPDIPVEHMASMEPVTYTARDGVEIPAFLSTPEGVEASNLSTIILPHGGPWSRDTWGYHGIVQFLANRGYAVLQPNFRGSTGYGKEFLNLGNEQWGTGDMQHDITDGVNWLIEEGIAHPDGVAIMGGSYGGYATLAGLAFTPELYATGVDIVGPSNIITLLNSIPPYWAPIMAQFDVRVGDLDDPEDVERMEAQSPLNFAENITAPLLVIQGANDPRVKQRESDQIVVTLRDLERDVEYMVAPDEGHGFANEDNNLAMFAKIEEFLAEHLGGRYQPEVEPEIRERLENMMVDVDTLTISEVASGPAGETITSFDGGAVEPVTLTYQQRVETQGQSFDISASRTISETTFEGTSAYLLVDAADTPMGSVSDSTWIDAATLVPLKRMVHQGPATVEVNFNGTDVTGSIQAGAQNMELNASAESTIFVKGAALETALGSLNMEPGEVATIHLFDPMMGAANAHRLEAAEVETIETPAGSFGALRFEFTSAEGDAGATIWIDTETGHMVRMTEPLPPMAGGGTATAELASIEN